MPREPESLPDDLRDPSHGRPKSANQHGDDLTFGEAQSATDAKAPDVRRAGFAGVGLFRLAKRAAVLTAAALLLIACGDGGAPSLPSGTSSGQQANYRA
jgi:hypothetical protein